MALENCLFVSGRDEFHNRRLYHGRNVRNFFVELTARLEATPKRELYTISRRKVAYRLAKSQYLDGISEFVFC